MDHSGFQDWLDRYVAAWKSYDATAIGELFSEDAQYRYHPEDEPISGREAILASWLDDQDEPGRFDASYEVLAIDGPEHVAMGWSRYYGDGGELDDEYWNIYRCQFDEDGRCRLFTEWWIRDREFARRDRQEPEHPSA